MSAVIVGTIDQSVIVTAEFETVHGGKEYWNIIKNGVPTHDFIEVTPGSDEADVVAAYELGSII